MGHRVLVATGDVGATVGQVGHLPQAGLFVGDHLARAVVRQRPGAA